MTPACPTGSCRAAIVVNRGAAIYGDKIIFGTLDAHLVALNRMTGRSSGTRSWPITRPATASPAAPMIVNGKVIYGNSGGEFGIVGKVEARDVKTGELVWSRPTIEGHMGQMGGKPSTMTASSTPPGRATSGRMAAAPPGSAGRTTRIRSSSIWGTGNPAPWTATCAPATTSTHLLDAGARPRDGRDQVSLPDDAARRLGLRRGE